MRIQRITGVMQDEGKHKTTDRYRGDNNHHHGSSAGVAMVVKTWGGR